MLFFFWGNLYLLFHKKESPYVLLKVFLQLFKGFFIVWKESLGCFRSGEQ